MPVPALALSLLLAAPPAAGSEARPTSSPRVRADALDCKLERAQRTRAREAEKIFREPGVQFRVCRACVELELLAKQIEFLRGQVETSAEDSPDYPDLLFRLADLYLQQKAHHVEQAAAAQQRIDGLEAELEPPC